MAMNNLKTLKIWPEVDFRVAMVRDIDETEYIAVSETNLRKQGADGKWYRLYIHRETRTTDTQMRKDESPNIFLSVHINDFLHNVYQYMLSWEPISGDRYWDVLDEDQRSEEERLRFLKPLIN
jgi:hypothetical protein